MLEQIKNISSKAKDKTDFLKKYNDLIIKVTTDPNNDGYKYLFKL